MAMRLLQSSMRFVAVMLTAWFVSAASSLAAEIIVVIDGSGSSAGRIAGVAKINIARGALRNVLSAAPSGLSIGLVAYGHRQREACSDVELIAPPGPTSAFLAAAERVQPLGRSPIAAAAEAAAEALSDPSAEATIIIITDNADNCAPDPCATISALTERMPNLTISVVGIAIPDEEISEIACFSELTGGLFLRADTANSFAENLEEVMLAAWGDPIPPLPPMPVAALSFPFGVIQGTPFSVEYQGPAAPGDEIRLAWVGTPPSAFITAARVPTDGTSVRLTAPREIGAFELRYWHSERDTIIARIPLAVAAIVPAVEAPAVVQRGADIPITWRANAEGGETIQIAEPLSALDAALVEAKLVRNEPMVTLPAAFPPGNYEIRLVAAAPKAPVVPELRSAEGRRILAVAAIKIEPAAITMAVADTVVAGTAFIVEWAGPGAAGDEIRLSGIGAEDWLVAVGASGTAVDLVAPLTPGVYGLQYWSAVLREVMATQQIAIDAVGVSVTAPPEIEGGATLQIAWIGPGGAGDRIAIRRNGAGGMAIVDSVRLPLFGAMAEIEAPVVPGTYDLAYVSGRRSLALASQAITVTPSVVALEAVDTVIAGERIEIRWQGPRGRFDELRLADEAGGIVASQRPAGAGPVTFRAPDEAGRYFVQYWAGSADVVLMSIAIDVTCPQCDANVPALSPELRLAPSP